MTPKFMLLNVAACAALTVSAATDASTHRQAPDPVANPSAVVRQGNARFTVLTPEMIRVEYSPSGKFEDKATFAVVNRNLPVPEFQKKESADSLFITTGKLRLAYKKGADLIENGQALNITFEVAGKPERWFPGKKDTQNLKGTLRTLDTNNGDAFRNKLEDGVISRSGWAVIDDSWSNVRPDGSRSFAMEPNAEAGMDWVTDRADKDALDLYFLGYGHDYKRAIADFTRIAGEIPLPPKYVFGYWYSRYWHYTDDDFRKIMHDLKSNKVPADVMVIDMDWHWNGNEDSQSKGVGGWTGWSWNTRLFPRPEALLDEMHANGYHKSLNIHPADGINPVESPRFNRNMRRELGEKYTDPDGTVRWCIDYPDFYKSFFKNVIREHEDEGTDFWWIDWQQHLTSKETPDLGETFWINHVFFNDMKNNRKDRRPVIYHRWGGLGSHRYQIGFSGDTYINFPTLAFEIYFTPTASNVGYAYWGHDLGGHMVDNNLDASIINDPELMLRWMQFGVFTPIFKSHATSDPRIERRIWTFPNFPDLLDAVRLRYTLVPYIYTMARKTYDTSIGMCRPLYYEYPEKNEAYEFESEYFFGDDILVAPIVEAAAPGKKAEKRIWFPEGKWWSASTHEMVSGPAVKTMQFAANEIPYFYRAGSVVPLNPDSVEHANDRPDTLILNVVAGTSGEGSLYEDEGDNNDYATNYAFTKFTHKSKGNTETIIINPREGAAAVSLPAERAWQLQIVNAKAPKSVRLDGKKLPATAWSYSRATRTLLVNLPKAPCSSARELKIGF